MIFNLSTEIAVSVNRMHQLKDSNIESAQLTSRLHEEGGWMVRWWCGGAHLQLGLVPIVDRLGRHKVRVATAVVVVPHLRRGQLINCTGAPAKSNEHNEKMVKMESMRCTRASKLSSKQWERSPFLFKGEYQRRE